MPGEDKPKTNLAFGVGGDVHPAMPIIFLFVTTMLVGALLVKFEDFILSRAPLTLFLEQFWLFLQGRVTLSDAFGATGSSFIVSLIFILKILSVAFSLAMVFLIFITLRKIGPAMAKMRSGLDIQPEEAPNVSGEAVPVSRINAKWQKVEDHINSKNSSDWRLAILEADIILGEMLEKMGYHGETMGEKLKNIEPSDFTTLDSAWEAHKVRNTIAHEGSEFLISQREAQRVVRLFEEVFREFKYI